MNEGMTPADVAAVVGDKTGGTGYVYPVFPYGAGSSGNSGFGNDGWVWLIVILALLGGFRGNNGGYGGESGVSSDFAWLSNGQKDIMQNTNDGFNTLELGNQLNNISSGVQGLSTQLCNCCADMNSTVSNGFANAESNANARQMANMQQNFDNQIATLQGFNSMNSQFANCCCENRLATQDLKSTVISENCADREALREIGQNILVNQTANTQKIIDEIFRDRLDEKDAKIDELNRQLTMADLRASQIAQTAQITAGQQSSANQLFDLLNSCPIPCTPVYGRTPIFTCNNNNGGCGCGNVYGNTLV